MGLPKHLPLFIEVYYISNIHNNRFRNFKSSHVSRGFFNHYRYGSKDDFKPIIGEDTPSSGLSEDDETRYEQEGYIWTAAGNAGPRHLIYRAYQRREEDENDYERTPSYEGLYQWNGDLSYVGGSYSKPEKKRTSYLPWAIKNNSAAGKIGLINTPEISPDRPSILTNGSQDNTLAMVGGLVGGVVLAKVASGAGVGTAVRSTGLPTIPAGVESTSVGYSGGGAVGYGEVATEAAPEEAPDGGGDDGGGKKVTFEVGGDNDDMTMVSELRDDQDQEKLDDEDDRDIAEDDMLEDAKEDEEGEIEGDVDGEEGEMEEIEDGAVSDIASEAGASEVMSDNTSRSDVDSQDSFQFGSGHSDNAGDSSDSY